MPLIKSKSPGAFKQNVRTLMHEVGKSPHVQSRAQALAIAYSTKRRGKADVGDVEERPLDRTLDVISRIASGKSKAIGSDWQSARRATPSPQTKAGGGMISPPWYERQAVRRMPYAGFVATSTPGRADAHKTSVPSGSYILPAEHIAALGQGNSLAGANVVKKMFAPGGKFGSKLKIPKFASGGRIHVPIKISGGEYHLDPEIVSQVGGGDMKKGHDILDNWVMETRKKHIARLRSLPKPKVD